MTCVGLWGRIARWSFWLMQSVVPKSRSVVVNTFPDFDDQGRAVIAAILEETQSHVTWLVCTPSLVERPLDLDPRVDVHGLRSCRGLMAYFRARVVVHTHGIHGTHPTSRRTRYLNLWHGMPVKRLNCDAPVSRNQTDVLLATSALHASHFTDTWALPRHRISVTGLPRNDLLVVGRPSASDSWPTGKRRVLWLPTFRRSVVGEIRQDGESERSPLEFGDLRLDDLSVMAGRIGAHVIVKTHPMTGAPETEVTRPHAEIWTERELIGHGTTLYSLLAEADVLITDHSSVWIDFLLTGRPILFAIADLPTYSATRGHYFEPLETWLPGPVVTEAFALKIALEQLFTTRDRWSAARQQALPIHHAHKDSGSARRAAYIVRDWLL